MAAQLEYCAGLMDPFPGDATSRNREDGDCLSVVITSLSRCIHETRAFIKTGRLRLPTNAVIQVLVESATDDEVSSKIDSMRNNLARLYPDTSKAAEKQRIVSDSLQIFSMVLLWFNIIQTSVKTSKFSQR
jgi:hypothetical protein